MPDCRPPSPPSPRFSLSKTAEGGLGILNVGRKRVLWREAVVRSCLHDEELALIDGGNAN
jgi:hypothetical protein